MNSRLARFEPYYPLLLQIGRFGIVGLTAAIVHFSTDVMLVQWFHIAPLIANVFGFMVAFQISYWGHRLWTFSDTMTSHRAAVSKLVVVQVANFGANETLFFIFLSMHLPYQVALLIVLSVLPIFTFLGSKLWVFR